jgi:hypothetical protein
MEIIPVPETLVFKMGEAPATLRTVLFERGWEEWDEETMTETSWHLLWRSGRFRPSEYAQANGIQRMNHFSKSGVITKKDSLLRGLRQLRAVHGAVYVDAEGRARGESKAGRERERAA